MNKTQRRIDIILGVILVGFLIAFMALGQTCDETFTLHNSACPSGAASCQNNAGDAISSEEHDANIRNSIDSCNAFDSHVDNHGSIGDTGPSPDCTGTTVYQDGEGTCDIRHAGSDWEADLEEETHASEHLENAADEITVEALGTACTDGQAVDSDGAGGVDCITVAGDVSGALDATVVADNSHNHLEANVTDLSHTSDTNANTICTGTDNYLDGEGDCDALTTFPGFTDLDTDYGDETITSDFNFNGGTLGLPSVTDCSSVITEGDVCWDSDGDTLCVGDGAACHASAFGDTNAATICTGADVFLQGDGGCTTSRDRVMQTWSPDQFADASVLVAGVAVAALGSDTGTNLTIRTLTYLEAADSCRGVMLQIPDFADASNGGARFTILSYSKTGFASTKFIRWTLKWHDLPDATIWDTAVTDEGRTSLVLSTTVDRIETTNWLVDYSTLGWSAKEGIILFLCRDSDHAEDTATADVEVVSFSVHLTNKP